MSIIIDRRTNPKHKHLTNRKRFLDRVKQNIKENLTKALRDRKIGDLSSEKISIPARSLDEPRFRYDRKKGTHRYILPGNKTYSVGDRIRKPTEGDAGTNGDAEGLGTEILEDEFEFVLNKDEFLNLIFDDLELPNLEKRQLVNIDEWVTRRAGFTNDGIPANLNLERTMIRSLGRRIALKFPKRRMIDELKDTIALLEVEEPQDEERLTHLRAELATLERRYRAVGFLDPLDIKYNHFQKFQEQKSQAVIFCIMDVSASMGEREKDIAKRFFILLHLFLTRKYKHVELVFIRHHTTATECDAEEFFKGRETGGTLISPAYELANEIIKDRYNLALWNVYMAQLTDGDNEFGDNGKCADILNNTLLPKIQFFAYVEIQQFYEQMYAHVYTKLWDALNPLFKTWGDKLRRNKIFDIRDIYAVFREFFKKASTHA